MGEAALSTRESVDVGAPGVGHQTSRSVAPVLLHSQSDLDRACTRRARCSVGGNHSIGRAPGRGGRREATLRPCGRSESSRASGRMARSPRANSSAVVVDVHRLPRFALMIDCARGRGKFGVTYPAPDGAFETTTAHKQGHCPMPHAAPSQPMDASSAACVVVGGRSMLRSIGCVCRQRRQVSRNGRDERDPRSEVDAGVGCSRHEVTNASPVSAVHGIE